MANEKDPKENLGSELAMRAAAEEPIEEWDGFVSGGNAATTIDPDALKKLRLVDSAPDMSDLVEPEVEAALPSEAPPSSTPFEALADDARAEFDDQEMTVMDSRSIAEREASETTVGTEACPKCGVMVAIGYPKCPRCKAVLIESAVAHRKTAGGTSVIGRTVPWTIVFIAAVLTGIIYYLAERDPKIEGLEADESGASLPHDTSSQPATSPDENSADIDLDEPEEAEPEEAEPEAEPEEAERRDLAR